MNITRHRAGLVASLASAALLLAACGSVEPEEPGSSGEATAGSADGDSTGGGDGSTITVTDDQGREVTIEGPVERAVVLNSYSHEFIRAIGAGDRVVGLDRTSLNRLPYLGLTEGDVVAENLQEINYESVIEAEPDVVIIPRNGSWEDAANQLDSFGIPVVVATAWDFDVFEDTITLLGEVFGEQDGAAEVAAFYEEIFTLLDERVGDADPVSVYFETEEPYLTALPGSGFDQMITAAGGENLFGDVTTGGDVQAETTVDPAEIVQRDPEVIFHELPPSYTPAGDEAFVAVADEIAARPGFSTIAAVQEDQVYLSNGWATSGLSKAIGALYLATWLHPEELSDIDPDAYLERWVTEFQGAEFEGADAYVRSASDLS